MTIEEYVVSIKTNDHFEQELFYYGDGYITIKSSHDKNDEYVQIRFPKDVLESFLRMIV